MRPSNATQRSTGTSQLKPAATGERRRSTSHRTLRRSRHGRARGRGSVDGDDVAVVQEPVEVGGGDDLVGEDLAPFGERLVRGRPRRPGQVNWGDEGLLLAAGGGTAKVYSFHVTLSYSRDPFICFTTSQGSGHVPRLPPPRVRALRRGPGHDRLRPPAPRPWSAATSPPAGRCRCTRRPPRSPPTTGSPSTCSPPIAPPGRGGWSGKCRSGVTTSWPGARYLAGRVGRRVRRLGADPPRAGPPHPRRADRGPRRPRPRRAGTAAAVRLRSHRNPTCAGSAATP